MNDEQLSLLMKWVEAKIEFELACHFSGQVLKGIGTEAADRKRLISAFVTTMEDAP